jgi:hypothetical protein
MQFSDGSVAAKVGALEHVSAAPPSADKSERFYIPACTSATIAAAGMFAHAALVFRETPQFAPTAVRLRQRAAMAWKNFQQAPSRQTDCDDGSVKAGDSDVPVEGQIALAVEAAVYLFALTGDEAYNIYVASHFREARPYRDLGWSRYNPDEGDALLYYTTTAGANPATREAILKDWRDRVSADNRIYGFHGGDDLYRAFIHDEQYHWGSSNVRANYGNSNLDVLRYGEGIANHSDYATRAIELLHYFHGVNPFGVVYLSNMYGQGASNSVNQLSHAWFEPDTKWHDARASACGPAPGYVPGGPNSSAIQSGVPATLTPPSGQPAQKSWRDYNAKWPQNSWVVNEPAIYYQSAYVKLLSAFVR